MDLTTAREIAIALVVLGATGAASMTCYHLALKSVHVDLLPNALFARVQWWRDHLTATLGVSTCLLLAGVLGLLLL